VHPQTAVVTLVRVSATATSMPRCVRSIASASPTAPLRRSALRHRIALGAARNRNAPKLDASRGGAEGNAVFVSEGAELTFGTFDAQAIAQPSCEDVAGPTTPQAPAWDRASPDGEVAEDETEVGRVVKKFHHVGTDKR